MTRRTLWGVIAVVFLAAAAVAAPPDTAPPAGQKAGSITALLPVANIVRGPAKQQVTAIAKKGDDVVWNDLVRTEKGGRARITLLDQSILSVGSQAELRVIKSDAKSQQTSIEVGYGRVRMEVTPITKQGGSFEVKTPTAVAGVIGTVFGIDSGIAVTTVLCIQDTVMVGSNDPSIPGRVPCPAGTAAVVGAGKAPTTRPATQQEIQQFVQDTEPAVISAMNPNSLLPGATTDAAITGTQLGNVNAVSSSSSSVTATLNAGATATSVSVHLVVAANATPGPVTITLSKPSGVNSAAVLTILSPQATAAAPSIKGLSTSAAPTTGGVPVTITGTNFDNNTKVMFGNVASSNVTFISATQLTAIVPPGSPGIVDITVVTGTGLSSTLSGGFSFGGPVAAISPQDITKNPGEQVSLDGSRSSDTLAGTTLTYSWTFCSLGFKPPQVGASLPPMNAPACNPAAGTVAGTDSQFSLSAPATYGQYFARLQVTDNLGGSAVIYSTVTVSQPTYDDPLTRMNLLAQAFSTLQSSQVLAFFDPSYTGLTSLQQSLQTVFATYSSMTVNLLTVAPNIGGNTAQIQANWQLKYTLKASNDPACTNVPNCQPQPNSPPADTTTTVWTLTPGKGWFITEFRLPNGFTQGALPAVPVANVTSPDLSVVAVISPDTPTPPSGKIPVGVGQQKFQATVQNIGTAALTAPTQVQFVLTDNQGNQLGGPANGDLGPIPLAAGATAQATATINVDPNHTLTAVTDAQITASLSFGGQTVSKGFTVVITPPTVALPDLAIVPGSLLPSTASSACGATQAQPCPLATGPQTFQMVVKNIGNAPFAPATAPAVQFTLDITSTTVSLPLPLPGGSLAVNASVQVVSPALTVPLSGSGTLTVTITGCPSPNVEPDCTNNTAKIFVLIAPVSVTVNSSANNSAPGAVGQATCSGGCSALELNGPLPQSMTLTPVRSDNVLGGTATLAMTDTAATVTTPQQVNAVPIGTPGGPVTVEAAIPGGNLTVGPAQVQITATTQGVPTAGPQLTTLFFNIGDIDLNPAPPACVQVAPGGQNSVSFVFSPVNGFNAQNVTWQWSGLTAGVSVSTVSGSGYSLPPSFTFTNSNTADIPGLQNFFFAATFSDPKSGVSTATKVFTFGFDLTSTVCPGGAAVRLSGSGSNGVWTRGGVGGGMAKAAPPLKTASGMLPDLQISAASVSFTPSIPKPGDTVTVRFRVTNAGNADAQRVPISLVVNGATVASDTFDVRTGASTLAALEWTNARGTSRSLQAAVVVDPNHTIAQKSTLAKSAPLVHFALLPAWGAQSGMQLASVMQRTTLEVADGACVGLRFASGASSFCGSADVEITVAQLAGGRFTLGAQNGITDLGLAFGGGKLAAVQYQSEVPAVAGHSYAVQLGGGKTGILRLLAIRNPAQAKATGRQVFSTGNVARNVGGQTTGPVETGDVSGVRTPNQSKAYFEISYQTQ